ncbi:hypothetical protein NW759_013049 [Fusarium solani]|nr:hypothetical protein NW759_013049 [Fusarium solani]
MAISISRLTFEHHRDPLGIGECRPRISWRFHGTGVNWQQSSYDIQLHRDSSPTLRTFHVVSSNSLYLPWPDSPLHTAESAQVRVRAHGQPGQVSTEWSRWTSVEAGLLSAGDWDQAVAIAADQQVELESPKRPMYFRKAFPITDEISRARLYITSLGVYEAEINGTRVGDYVMAPGWQSYHHRHIYNSYDVTDLLSEGQNAIGVIVGEGWFCGRLGYGGGQRNHYGDGIGVFCLLVVTLKNGTQCKIPTDLSWQSSMGPLLSSEIYDGEQYDSRLEANIKGWSSPHFDAASWVLVKPSPPIRGTLTPPDGPPVRRMEELRPREIFRSPSNKLLVDFGQNLVGWIRLTVGGRCGSKVTLKFAEVLEHGELSTRPLRFAAASDSLILNGTAAQVWEPRFSYHGFRYAQIYGLPDDVKVENCVTAVVVHSDMEETGWFKCSNTLLNQFHRNIRWSMKGNFFYVPTDCPQRDERLGWTGDALAFGPTANFLYDTAGFWRGWHKDLWSDMQDADMVPPFFVPAIHTKHPSRPAAVWGDVAVAGPWNLYRAFGDDAMLAEQHSQAQSWLDVGLPRNSEGLWARNLFQFADWLDPKAPPESPGDATTPKDLVADAYLIRMTQFMAEISSVLERETEAKRYRRQHSELVSHFQDAWVKDGLPPTQTAYTLALHFGLLSGQEQKETAARVLRELVAQNDYLVGTGFAGTPCLGFALHNINATEDFYRMLLQTQLPSWLYQVVQGGTTTWERWDSLLPDGTVNPGEMTSFNHYAFGSVADWMHQVIGGIAPLKPGWKKFLIAPVPGGNITNAEIKFVSQYGEIHVEWWLELKDKNAASPSHTFQLRALIPPNSRASVRVPGSQETFEVGSGWFKYRGPYYPLS